MKNKILVLAVALCSVLFFNGYSWPAKNQALSEAFTTGEIYSAAYGNPRNPAIIFIHGGPGLNAASFEFSTAQALAGKGFYVIVYDQRGGGRSKGIKNSFYTFAEAGNDLNYLYKKYNISEATLIGHSWGGTIATMFAEKNPGKVKNIVLVGAPVDYQQTFTAIIDHCTKVYSAMNPAALKYLDFVKKMDKTSLDYSSASFYHAVQCGLYGVKDPLDSAKLLFKKLAASKESKFLFDSALEPVKGFYSQEKYTTLNLTDKLNKLKSKINIYGIYGSEDGLFESEQLAEIARITGKDNFKLVDRASHSVFIDNQPVFLETLLKFLKSEKK